MTRIALAFILLHHILPPVLFTSSIKFPGFNMREESLLLFTFEVTNEWIFNVQGGCSHVGFGVGFWFFGWLFLIQCIDYLDLYFWEGTLIFQRLSTQISTGSVFVLSSLQCSKDFQSPQNTVCQYFENKLVSLI